MNFIASRGGSVQTQTHYQKKHEQRISLAFEVVENEDGCISNIIHSFTSVFRFSLACSFSAGMACTQEGVVMQAYL